jgi:tetratricopeptide (TPR) repeat protein
MKIFRKTVWWAWRGVVWAAALVSAHGAEDSAVHVRAAQVAMRADKTDEALAAVRRAVAADPRSEVAAGLLDTLGATAEAREVWQRRIASAEGVEAQAAAWRARMLSYAFDGDWANAAKDAERAIAAWATREAAEPQVAFFRQSEIAHEVARVCLQAGKLDEAEAWFRRSAAYAVKEPEPKAHPAGLGEFWLAEALARVAARRGNLTEVKWQLAVAQPFLAGDAPWVGEARRVWLGLMGYVALYTGDMKTAEAELTRAIARPGNERDPALRCWLAMHAEMTGKGARATALYREAYDLAVGHDEASAFARPFARNKLYW